VVAHLPSAALSLALGALRAGLAAVLLALFARAFVLELRVVSGSSMVPTLLPGDRVLVDRMLYASDLPPSLVRLLPVRAPIRGDVVLARSPDDGRSKLIKRCVALSGDRIGPGLVPPGAVWLEGDHAADSRDSRAFGAVDRQALAGRVVRVLASKHPAGSWRWSRTLRAVR
jgi:signal peptidase I